MGMDIRRNATRPEESDSSKDWMLKWVWFGLYTLWMFVLYVVDLTLIGSAAGLYWLRSHICSYLGQWCDYIYDFFQWAKFLGKLIIAFIALLCLHLVYCWVIRPLAWAISLTVGFFRAAYRYGCKGLPWNEVMQEWLG